MAIYNWWNVTRINSKASNQQRAMKHNTHNRPFIINWFKSWVLQVSDHAHAIHIRGLTTTRLYSNNTKHEPTDTMPPVLKYCLACLNINYIAQRLSTHPAQSVKSHLRGKRERSCVRWCRRFLYCWETRTSWALTSTRCWRTGGIYSLRMPEEKQNCYAVCDGTSS